MSDIPQSIAIGWLFYMLMNIHSSGNTYSLHYRPIEVVKVGLVCVE